MNIFEPTDLSLAWLEPLTKRKVLEDYLVNYAPSSGNGLTEPHGSRLKGS